MPTFKTLLACLLMIFITTSCSSVRADHLTIDHSATNENNLIPIVPGRRAPNGPLCSDDRDKVLLELLHNYGEVPISLGITQSGSVVELLVNQKTGSWTLTLTTVVGQTCLIAAGQDWMVREVAVGPES